MSNSTTPSKIDRQAAAKINPLISDTKVTDTLARTCQVIRSLAVIQATPGIELPEDHVPLILEVIAAALDFEAENPHLATKPKATEGEPST